VTWLGEETTRFPSFRGHHPRLAASCQLDFPADAAYPPEKAEPVAPRAALLHAPSDTMRRILRAFFMNAELIHAWRFVTQAA